MCVDYCTVAAEILFLVPEISMQKRFSRRQEFCFADFRQLPTFDAISVQPRFVLAAVVNSSYHIDIMITCIAHLIH